MEGRNFEKELHLKYWKRCLKSLLPTEYTSNDSSRMTLGFFILSALDLLGEGVNTFPQDEKKEIRDWIIKCQHPNGGFCGSPNHKFPEKYYVDLDENCRKRDVDPANLPATYFAILSLGLVGDIRKIERIKCLQWLKKLQREDGSFGELLTPEGKVWGGRDMRYCYVAAAIRWILGGDRQNSENDINIENLVKHIRSGQVGLYANVFFSFQTLLTSAKTFDGGFSESSHHEAHDLRPGICNISETLRWLVSRQVGYQVPEDDENVSEKYVGIDNNLQEVYLEQTKIKNEFFADLVDKSKARQFLLEQTQYKIGGFGKSPGDHPALSLNEEPNIKKLDPALCVSVEQKNEIVRLRDNLLLPTRLYWKHGYCFCENV